MKMFKVRKRGKTRGRPSKAEKLCELYLANWWKKNKADWIAAYRRFILWGDPIVVDPQTGKIENVSHNEFYGKGIPELLK